jgi:hypothetical protein
MTNRYQEIAKRASAGAQARGFDACTWENFPGKLAFMLSELEEARLATCKQSTLDQVLEELTDCASRIAAYLHEVFGEWALRTYDDRRVAGFDRSFAAVENEIRVWLFNALKFWRDRRHEDVRICLEYAFRAVEAEVQLLGFDLAEQIEKKLAVNADRPRLHGHLESLG